MQPMEHNRGQAYALEGIIGAIIVVSALVLGLQAVDIAPWTGSQTLDSSETRTEVADMLAVAEDAGALQEAVTCVDDDGDPHPDVAATEDNVSELGAILNRTLESQYSYRIAVGVDGTETQIGPTPSLPNTDTVTASRTVVLSDTDPVYEVDPQSEQCRPAGTLEDAGDLYIDDQHGDESLYAVVRIRVIAW
ncbi:hypothetical protein GRX03_08500 [Halovenus sp. WSH3]|uniref:Uncharacterized protein n=1 Tax=Halovenus carboxidivorans TaxID=2692199 RepID=A0A6B0T8S8_9EURY|nr:hypothetical protein [Halovenus carboxidivorans]MXR51641.1 hypothetical protein [Halovenus carboxidivorans]